MTDLPPGRWVRDSRGVWRFRPDPPPAKPSATPKKTWNETRSYDTAHPCPRCGAGVGQSCRTRSGNQTYSHRARIHRPCPDCGADLPAQRRYCDACASRRRVHTWQTHYRRRRTRRPSPMEYPETGDTEAAS